MEFRKRLIKLNTRLFLILVLIIAGVFVFVGQKSVTTISAMHCEKRELLATNTYNIVFVKNNDNAIGTMEIVYGVGSSQTITLPTNAFEVRELGVTSKQIFKGWNTEIGGTGTSYADGASVSGLSSTNGATVTLYAQWEDANYQISAPVRYKKSLQEAVNVAVENSTITLIKSFSASNPDSSSVIISKNLNVNINGNNLYKDGTIVINNGATVTFKGGGTVIENDDVATNLFTLTDGAKLIKNGNAVWKAFNGYVIHSSSSSFELNGGYLVSDYNRTIYAYSIVNSSITNTNVYTGTYTEYAIRATGSGNLTISGDSKIGNGTQVSYESSSTPTPVPVIEWISSGTLTLSGNATIYGSSMGSCGIAAGENATVECFGASSIYVNFTSDVVELLGGGTYGYDIENVNPLGHCIVLQASSTLYLNTTGGLFTQSRFAIAFKTDNNNNSGTFNSNTFTRAKIATRIDQHVIWRYKTTTTHVGTPKQECFYEMSGYNSFTSHTWYVYEYEKKATRESVNPPSNVRIAPDGAITWDASSNATGYQIKIENGSWKEAKSGQNFYNDIIEVGSENVKVYVRGTNSDTTNYLSPSLTASATIRTYFGYKLSKSTGIDYAMMSSAGYGYTLGGITYEGGSTSALRLLNGEVISIYAKVTHGYTWANWTDNNNNNSIVTTSIEYSGTVDETTGFWNYRANAIVSTYIVTYNSNKPFGASESVTGTTANSSHTYGIPKNLTANGYSLTGWKFEGWNSKSDGTGTNYTDQQSVSNLTSTNGATVILYAIWTANTYKVEYYQGNNSTTAGATKIGESTHTYGQAQNLTTYANLKTSSGKSEPQSWVFYGWSANNGTTLTSRTYTDGQSVNNLTSTDNGIIKIYAIFKRTIKFNSGLNCVTTSNVEQRYNPYKTTGSITAVSAPAPSMTGLSDPELGWAPIGYRANKTAGVQAYAVTTSSQNITPAYNVYDVETATSTTVNLYAVYTRDLTMAYNGNGSTGGTTASHTSPQFLNTSNNTVNSADFITSDNGFTKTGNTFANWAENSAGTLNPVDEGENVEFSPAYNSTELTKTMYAIWTANTYKVEFYQGNNTTTAGSTKLGEQTFTYGQAQNLTTYSTLGGTAPQSWVFNGWSANNGTTATTRTYTNGQSVNNLTATDNDVIKIYAIFQRNIKFNSGVNCVTNSTVQQRYNPYKTTGSITSVQAPVPSITGLSDYGWSALGYRANKTATTAGYAVTTTVTNITPEYNVYDVTTATSNTVNLYAVYSRTVTLYHGLNKAQNSTPTQYMNTSENAVSQISAPAPSTTGLSDYGWSAMGYREDTGIGD